jgi:mannose-6-phosphate isomerase-like protein (cupin superfamily)
MTMEDQLEECRATAALYSLGALPVEEEANFLQRVTSGCPLCTSQLEEYSLVAQELAWSVPEENPPAFVRDRLLARVQGPPQPPNSPDEEMKLVRAKDGEWLPLPFPGVEVRPLLGRRTLLVRMQPGSVYPSHAHRYDEQCYVLEGSVTDSNGITALAGDFVCMRAGSTHQDIRTETGCTFFLAYTS